MKNEKWDDVHGNTTPDDRMVAFLESPTDSYAILQLREDVDDNIPLMFANYSYLQKKEMEPEINRYEVVYHGSISMSEDVNMPTHFVIYDNPAFKEASVVQLEQIRTIDKSRIDNYLGKVTPREMVAIEKALSVSLAMEQLKKRSPKHKAKRAKE